MFILLTTVKLSNKQSGWGYPPFPYLSSRLGGLICQKAGVLIYTANRTTTLSTAFQSQIQ